MIKTKKEAFVINWGNSKCSCIFNTDHNLPCKHLLYLAIAKNKLSDLHLAVRWLKSASNPILSAAEEEEKENLNEDLDHSDEDSDEDSDEESDDQDMEEGTISNHDNKEVASDDEEGNEEGSDDQDTEEGTSSKQDSEVAYNDEGSEEGTFSQEDEGPRRKKKKSLTREDMYLKSTALFKDMSETLNMMSTAQFQRYMSFLRKVKKNMNEGKLCSLKEGI